MCVQPKQVAPDYHSCVRARCAPVPDMQAALRMHHCSWLVLVRPVRQKEGSEHL